MTIDSTLSELVSANKLRLTRDVRKAVKAADCVVICAPTPTDRLNRPDTSILTEVLRMIGRSIAHGKLVVIESTVYPGFTHGIARGLLEESGMKCGTDFALAHSPSRVDPGNARYNAVAEIPKVLGGVGPLSGKIASLLYQSIIEAGVVSVSDATAAECVKMLENTYRFVNIAFVNELAAFFQLARVSIFWVVEAASSKASALFIQVLALEDRAS